MGAMTSWWEEPPVTRSMGTRVYDVIAGDNAGVLTASWTASGLTLATVETTDNDQWHRRDRYD